MLFDKMKKITNSYNIKCFVYRLKFCSTSTLCIKSQLVRRQIILLKGMKSKAIQVATDSLSSCSCFLYLLKNFRIFIFLHFYFSTFKIQTKRKLPLLSVPADDIRSIPFRAIYRVRLAFPSVYIPSCHRYFKYCM